MQERLSRPRSAEGRETHLTLYERAVLKAEGELGRMPSRVFGYADATLVLSVEANTTVDVPLTPAPLALDSLRVDLETLDFDGRVVDPEKELRLVDADVLSSQGHQERTNAHGNFDLDDIYQDVPLRILIQSFGYLPLDTTLVPDGDGRHEFDMAVDSAVQRVIDMQVERIVDVTRGRPSGMRPLNRESLLRHKGTFTVYDMIVYEYGRRADRVGCIVVDEKQIPRSRNWRDYPTHMLPEELERLEFLRFRGGGCCGSTRGTPSDSAFACSRRPARIM